MHLLQIRMSIRLQKCLNCSKSMNIYYTFLWKKVCCCKQELFCKLPVHSLIFFNVRKDKFMSMLAIIFIITQLNKAMLLGKLIPFFRCLHERMYCGPGCMNVSSRSGVCLQLKNHRSSNDYSNN